MNKKTKTTSTQNSTQTTTPNAPSWVSPQVSTLAGKTTDLASQDPYSFVAGADPLQTQAAQGAAGLGQNQDSYGVANRLLTGLTGSGANTYNPATVSPNSILPNLDKYMSPYLKDVVSSSLAGFDFNAGQQQGQNALARANSDTFGGSGGDVQTAMSNAQMGRDRFGLQSGLLNQGFGAATSLASDDANRRQQAQLANQAAFNSAGQFNATQNDDALSRQMQAALGLVNVDQTGNADQRSNIGLQGDMGGILQQIAQQRAGAPLSVNQAINGSYGSLVPATSLLTGQTSTGTATGTSKSSTSDPLGSLGKVAQIAATAAMFSDERLKEDIETIGHDAKGRRWVSYRYLWDEPDVRHNGVIAQEVAKTDPHAVSRHESGYLMVNYGELS